MRYSIQKYVFKKQFKNIHKKAYKLDALFSLYKYKVFSRCIDDHKEVVNFVFIKYQPVVETKVHVAEKKSYMYLIILPHVYVTV